MRCSPAVWGILALLAILCMLDAAQAGTTKSGVVAFQGEYHYQRTPNATVETGPCIINVANKDSAVPGLGVAEVLIRFGFKPNSADMVFVSAVYSGVQEYILHTFTDSGFWTQGASEAGVAEQCRVDGILVGDASPPTTLTGRFASADCLFRAGLEVKVVDTASLERRIGRYSVLANFAACIQHNTLFFQLRHSDGRNNLNRLSLAMLLAMTLSDGCDTMIHFVIGFSLQFTQTFNGVVLVAVFKFLVLGVAQIPGMLSVFRAQNPEQPGVRPNALVGTFYARTFALQLVLTVCVYAFMWALPVLAVLAQLYWVPQIVSDVVSGSRRTLHPSFVWCTALSRLFVPIYVWGCPTPLFNEELFPDAPFSTAKGFAVAMVFFPGGPGGIDPRPTQDGFTLVCSRCVSALQPQL
mmetsp:Transcript_79859/g.182984  ORF Transcript_79859/g.182984 Transcript_79859/m.182984 type:complete len:410 (-) Transcript_79859:269-1498(-)